MHAPLSRCKVRQDRNEPWYISIREELIEAKKQRRRLESLCKTSPLTVHKQMFNAAKRSVAKLVHQAQSSFMCGKIERAQADGNLFGVFGDLCGRDGTSFLPTVYPASQLPSVFSDYFDRKVADIRTTLDQQAQSLSSFDYIKTDPDMYQECTTVFDHFEDISASDLRDIIVSSKPTTCPLDPVPTPLFLEVLDILLPCLTDIVNDSLKTGTFPSSYKTASVKPLLKKDNLDVNNLKNYRPVSNLSFVSKVIEKVIQRQLFQYLESNALLPVSQSAYRPRHSVETALIKVVNDLLLAMDRGNVTILTLLDLSSAFDTIDHDILLGRLFSLYGISGTALDWFRSYLSNRTQFVTIDDCSSEKTDVKLGVPQGSVLGPILFILYTKPLFSLIEKHSLKCQSYADDSQLLKSCPPQHLHSAIVSTQECASDIKVWMTRNRLKLNDDKTEALIVHAKNCSDLDDSLTSLKVGEADITFSKSARDLGFMLSAEQLSLREHVTLICQSANYELRRISSVRQYLTRDATKVLVCSFVLSRLDFLNGLLSGCDKKHHNRLQLVQNNAARLIYRAKRRDHVSPLLRELHWLPIEARIEYKLCTLCFNFFLGTAPAYFSEVLTRYSCPREGMRSASDQRTLKSFNRDANLATIGHRSFSACAPKAWNSLPQHVRHRQTPESFKTALKTFLFRKYHDQ
jgi:hypothetical protein